MVTAYVVFAILMLLRRKKRYFCVLDEIVVKIKGTDQTCFTLRPDPIGARSPIAAGPEAIHRAFEV